MKKLQASAFLASAAIMAASPFIGAVDVSAASTSFSDYGSLNRNTLNNVFSRSKIYYTENTVITAVKVGEAGTLGQSFTIGSGDTFSSGNIKPGETFTALIEHSTAKDAEGNELDVLYKVSDVVYWNNELNEDGTTKSRASVNFVRNIVGSTSDTHPTNDTAQEGTTIHAGDPILAWNNATRSDSLFTVEFCKRINNQTTYKAATDSCDIETGMTSVSSMMWDFDVPNSNRNKDDAGNPIVKPDGWYDYGEDGDKRFHGNEGILPTLGANTIYMNMNKTTDGTTLSTEQNGFSVKDINGASYDGIWFGNSIMVTSTGLSGSWSYRYSGRGCGIGFLFGSAVPYAMPQPVKSVDKTSAKVGDTVTYSIVQEVPNNYSSEVDMITFASLYGNYSAIPQNKGYASLKITDTFQDGLKMPAAEAVKITNEAGVDVTDKFTINIDGQNLIAEAKNAATNIDLYGHIFTIKVETVVTSNVAISPVENTAKTTFTPAGDTTGQDLPSNKVETGLVRTVITRHVDDKTGKEIANPSRKDYPQGADYSTNALQKLPKGYELVKIPSNAKGKVEGKDIEVIYRYRKIANPNTLDASAGAFIGAALAGIVGGGLFFGVKRRR